jgi:hypothetical protein
MIPQTSLVYIFFHGFYTTGSYASMTKMSGQVQPKSLFNSVHTLSEFSFHDFGPSESDAGVNLLYNIVV